MAAAMLVVLGLIGGLSATVQPEDSVAGDDLLAALTEEIIPEEGAETAYGEVLSYDLLPRFVQWWYDSVPAAEQDVRYRTALEGLVAPCCDDNSMFICCCEQDGQACNIIRSGKGLAAHLILDSEAEYAAEQIRESVLQWVMFARPDYYISAAMQRQNIDPEPFGLTTYGSCYRGLCDAPISQGGCGGMSELIEPLLER